MEKKCENMENTNSKNVILSVLAVAILLIAVIGISYAIFLFTSAGKEKNIVRTGSITMHYIESDTNVISITNAMPTADEVGKNQTEYFDFRLEANVNGKATIDYEIRAKRIDAKTSSALNGSLVKLYLERVNQNLREVVLAPTTFKEDHNTLLDQVQGESMLLYRGKYVNQGQNKSFNEQYRLRMWLSDQAPIENTPKTFKIKVDVYSALQK